MKYGVVLPGGTAPEQVAQAVLAERSGWDGVFVWEAAYGIDAWTLLAGMAAATSRVRLGTMLTPLPWRRPWKVASQAATLSQLSGGRAVLAVGVGAFDPSLPDGGEITDLRVRASMLDEGIDLMRVLWSGGAGFQGVHYRFTTPPQDVAAPVGGSVPIWVVGVWPRPKSMRRVLRCDGFIPQFDEPSPSALRDAVAWLGERGVDVDVVVDGETSFDSARDQVRPWADAGATWWLETRWALPHHSEERMTEIRTRLAAGPPA